MGEDIKGTLSRWMDMLQGNGVEETEGYGCETKHQVPTSFEDRTDHLHKMQSDDVIWSVINHQFCSYKVKYVYVFSSLVFLADLWAGAGQRPRIFVETNITLQASAIANHVH